MTVPALHAHLGTSATAQQVALMLALSSHRQFAPSDQQSAQSRQTNADLCVQGSPATALVEGASNARSGQHFVRLRKKSRGQVTWSMY